jgi:hypothetical protein
MKELESVLKTEESESKLEVLYTDSTAVKWGLLDGCIVQPKHVGAWKSIVW